MTDGTEKAPSETVKDVSAQNEKASAETAATAKDAASTDREKQTITSGDVGKVDGLLGEKHDNERRDPEARIERAAGEVSTTNEPRAPQRVAMQHRAVEEENAKRNADNAPGQAAILRKAEDEAAEANARTQHADDPRANHTPTGKQRDRATPRRIDADGTKHW